MTERLERALIAIARRYAPELVPPGWTRAGDYPAPLPDLARRLAAQGALALMGDLMPGAADAGMAFRAWADGYTRMYAVLCAPLFPSYTEVSAFFVDQEQPPVVVIVGAAAPVIETMAGIIAPYVVMRQGAAAAGVTAAELDQIVRLALDELEAGDLPPDALIRLRDETVAALRSMLSASVRQYGLIPAARDLFAPPPPPSLPL
jgi:hypothetical protein